MYTHLPTKSKKGRSKDDHSSFGVYDKQKEKARLREEKEKKAQERRKLREARKQVVVITPGLEEDILKLKNEFQLFPEQNFKNFKEAVKKTHFNLIYSGIKTYRECIQSVEKILNYAKFIWLESQSLSDSVFGFYVLGLLYFIQPVVGAVQIRLSGEEMNLVYNFIVHAAEADNLEVFVLFKKLSDDSAFLPCYEKDVKVFHNESKVKPTMPESLLPSSLVETTKSFMDTINKYKARREASSTLCPSHIVSNNKLDFDFFAQFINPSFSRTETQEQNPSGTDVATDTNIGDRRRALKEKSFKFIPGKGQEDQNATKQDKESESENESDIDELGWMSSLNLNVNRKDHGSEPCASTSGTQPANSAQGRSLSYSDSDTDASLPELQMNSDPRTESNLTSQFEYTSGTSDLAHSFGGNTTACSASMPLLHEDDGQQLSDGMISELPSVSNVLGKEKAQPSKQK